MKTGKQQKAVRKNTKKGIPKEDTWKAVKTKWLKRGTLSRRKLLASRWVQNSVGRNAAKRYQEKLAKLREEATREHTAA